MTTRIRLPAPACLFCAGRQAGRAILQAASDAASVVLLLALAVALVAKRLRT